MEEKKKTNREYYGSPILKEDSDGFSIRKPAIDIRLPYLGTICTKSTDEIVSSNWFLGCETLDRDYADYDQYKEYIKPLGIKYIRLQGGWAKTEKVRGVYDWQWLDHIIDDAISRGYKPWLQTSYGNSIYPGAGGENLGAGMPLSEEGMAAYEAWVKEMVSRYAEKVFDWEVWNEPNIGDNKVNTPEIAADFNIRTARIIKAIQPLAKISCLSLAHFDREYMERFFKYLYESDACNLFHNVTYHDYTYNPDSNKLAVYQIKQIVDKYAPAMIIRQGENGAPSVEYAGGALADYGWSELSQAKWDARRMLENLGNDIQCSIFGIAEMQYTGNGPIQKVNTKGFLQTDALNRVIRPKVSYFTVQHIAAIFDDSLERIASIALKHRVDGTDTDKCWVNTDRGITVYGYRNKSTEERLYTIWKNDAIPGDDREPTPLEFAFVKSNFKEPVFIDIITGNVYGIPAEQWVKDGNIDRFRNIPVYDGPIVIGERNMFSIISEGGL